MHSPSLKNTVNTYPQINIKGYVKSFLLNIREKEVRIFNINCPGDVAYMKELINTPAYTTFKSARDVWTGNYYWNEQKVDYDRSNLGRGYIFYFICNGCRRRAKYLYEYNILHSPVCRICCGLGYEAPPNKARELIRLLRKWHDPVYSSEVRWMIAKRAGIRIEDISDPSLKQA